MSCTRDLREHLLHTVTFLVFLLQLIVCAAVFKLSPEFLCSYDQVMLQQAVIVNMNVIRALDKREYFVITRDNF